MKGDLRSRRLIVAKGVLFLLIGAMSALLIVWRSAEGQTAVLLLITVWGFCRFYYFLFHALESYVDSQLQWRGLTHLLSEVWKRFRRRKAAVDSSLPTAQQKRPEAPRNHQPLC